MSTINFEDNQFDVDDLYKEVANKPIVVTHGEKPGWMKPAPTGVDPNVDVVDTSTKLTVTTGVQSFETTKAKHIDGDTVKDSQGAPIRMRGVDTAESVHKNASKNSQEGTDASTFVEGITPVGTKFNEVNFGFDKYGRRVSNLAVATSKGEVDLGLVIMDQGFSEYYDRFGHNPEHHTMYSNYFDPQNSPVLGKKWDYLPPEEFKDMTAKREAFTEATAAYKRGEISMEAMQDTMYDAYGDYEKVSRYHATKMDWNNHTTSVGGVVISNADIEELEQASPGWTERANRSVNNPSSTFKAKYKEETTGDRFSAIMNLYNPILLRNKAAIRRARQQINGYAIPEAQLYHGVAEEDIQTVRTYAEKYGDTAARALADDLASERRDMALEDSASLPEMLAYNTVAVVAAPESLAVMIGVEAAAARLVVARLGFLPSWAKTGLTGGITGAGEEAIFGVQRMESRLLMTTEQYYMDALFGFGMGTAFGVAGDVAISAIRQMNVPTAPTKIAVEKKRQMDADDLSEQEMNESMAQAIRETADQLAADAGVPEAKDSIDNIDANVRAAVDKQESQAKLADILKERDTTAEDRKISTEFDNISDTEFSAINKTFKQNMADAGERQVDEFTGDFVPNNLELMADLVETIGRQGDATPETLEKLRGSVTKLMMEYPNGVLPDDINAQLHNALNRRNTYATYSPVSTLLNKTEFGPKDAPRLETFNDSIHKAIRDERGQALIAREETSKALVAAQASGDTTRIQEAQRLKNEAYLKPLPEPERMTEAEARAKYADVLAESTNEMNSSGQISEDFIDDDVLEPDELTSAFQNNLTPQGLTKEVRQLQEAIKLVESIPVEQKLLKEQAEIYLGVVAKRMDEWWASTPENASSFTPYVDSTKRMAEFVDETPSEIQARMAGERSEALVKRDKEVGKRVGESGWTVKRERMEHGEMIYSVTPDENAPPLQTKDGKPLTREEYEELAKPVEEKRAALYTVSVGKTKKPVQITTKSGRKRTTETVEQKGTASVSVSKDQVRAAAEAQLESMGLKKNWAEYNAVVKQLTKNVQEDPKFHVPLQKRREPIKPKSVRVSEEVRDMGETRQRKMYKQSDELEAEVEAERFQSALDEAEDSGLFPVSAKEKAGRGEANQIEVGNTRAESITPREKVSTPEKSPAEVAAFMKKINDRLDSQLKDTTIQKVELRTPKRGDGITEEQWTAKVQQAEKNHAKKQAAENKKNRKHNAEMIAEAKRDIEEFIGHKWTSAEEFQPGGTSQTREPLQSVGNVKDVKNSRLENSDSPKGVVTPDSEGRFTNSEADLPQYNNYGDFDEGDIDWNDPKEVAKYEARQEEAAQKKRDEDFQTDEFQAGLVPEKTSQSSTVKDIMGEDAARSLDRSLRAGASGVVVNRTRKRTAAIKRAEKESIERVKRQDPQTRIQELQRSGNVSDMVDFLDVLRKEPLNVPVKVKSEIPETPKAKVDREKAEAADPFLQLSDDEAAQVVVEAIVTPQVPISSKPNPTRKKRRITREEAKKGVQLGELTPTSERGKEQAQAHLDRVKQNFQKRKQESMGNVAKWLTGWNEKHGDTYRAGYNNTHLLEKIGRGLSYVATAGQQTIADQFLKSGSVVANTIGVTLTELSRGYGGRVKRWGTAGLIKDRGNDVQLLKIVPDYVRDLDEFARSKGANSREALYATQAGDRSGMANMFSNQVREHANNLRLGRVTENVDPIVERFLKKYNEFHRSIHNEAVKAKLVGYKKDNFQENFIPPVFQNSKVRDAIKMMGADNALKLFSEAYKQGSAATGQTLTELQALDFARNKLMKILDSKGADPWEQASSISSKGNTEPPLMDTSVEIDGISIEDLLEDDVLVNMYKYSNRTMGKVALSQATEGTIRGSMDIASMRDLLSADTNHDPKMLQYYDDIIDGILGRPTRGGLSPEMRMLQDLTVLTKMGGLGSAQLIETGNIIGRRLTDMWDNGNGRSLFKQAGADYDDLELHREMESIYGITGEYEWLHRQNVHLDQRKYAEVHSLRKMSEDVVHYGTGGSLKAPASRLLGKVTGHNLIRKTQQEIIHKNFLVSVSQYFNGGGKMDARRLADLGLTDTDGTNELLQEQFRKYAKFSPEGHVISMGVEKWDFAAVEQLQIASHRNYAQMLHKTIVGELPAFMNKPLMKVLLQFREMPLVTQNKQLARQMAFADKEAVITVVANMMTAGLVRNSKRALFGAGVAVVAGGEITAETFGYGDKTVDTLMMDASYVSQAGLLLDIANVSKRLKESSDADDLLMNVAGTVPMMGLAKDGGGLIQGINEKNAKKTVDAAFGLTMLGNIAFAEFVRKVMMEKLDGSL